jgi:VWFA-related protein
MRVAVLACFILVSLQAQTSAPPRNARDAFEAGVKAAEGKRTFEARRNFQRAVSLYPRYAAAWQALGRLQAGLNELDAARDSYEAAIRAEPSHADLYFELAGLEQNAKNWKALINVSGRLLKINASDYPEVYLLNATGYYQTGDLAPAEERARAGEKLDTRQQYPKINELLGWILLQRGNSADGQERLRSFEAAAEEFRRYLKSAPATKHSEEVRATLEQLESLLPAPASARAALPPAASATPPVPLPGILLRSTVTLVQVDVIAQNKDGRPVADLKNEDFTVLDNGKPRPVTSFVVETTVQKPAARRQAAPNTFTNRLTDADSSRGGYAVILMDWFNTEKRDMQRTRPDVVRAVKQLGPSGKVALYSLDYFHGLHVVNEFGSDVSEVLKSLETMDGQISPCVGGDACDGDPEIVAAFTDGRVTGTLKALQAISDHLAGLAGRKSLIWVSAGIPTLVKLRPDGGTLFPNAIPMNVTYGDRIDEAMRKLNDAKVSLYPVDARGLMAGGQPMTDYGLTTPIMDWFASRTGGVAFYGRNDIDMGIQTALDDSRVTYLLGYYVPQDASQTGFHRLSVKVNRPGVKLRFREGYTVAEPGAVVPEDQKTQLAQASLNLMGATTIPFDVTASRKQNALTLRITVNPANLGLSLKGDRWQGKIDVATRFATDKSGEASTLWFEPIDIDLSQQNYEERSRDGLVFPKTLDIPADAKKVIVLMRSSALGTVGSLTIPLGEVRQN